MIPLTIGLATHSDFDGAYYTLQALRFYHADVMLECELVVVDNSPQTPHGQALRDLFGNWLLGSAIQGSEQARVAGYSSLPANVANVQYVPYEGTTGTAAPRDLIFQAATGSAVLVLDSHVFLAPGCLRRLIDYYRAHPDTLDLLSGPMVYDDLRRVSTHFADVWRGGMWGTLDTDERWQGEEPFEIPAMGLGAFTCRKDAWPGFNPAFREFGGEEHYIHEKVRQHGGKALCLPWLRWLHKFGRVGGIPYPASTWGKVRNYVIGYTELGLPLERVRRHFVEGVSEDGSPWAPGHREANTITPAQWQILVKDPANPPEKMPAVCNAQQMAQQAPVQAPPQPTLEERYFRATNVPSDINEHGPRLRELATGCDTVVDFGMRADASTVALLAGQPRRLVSHTGAGHLAGVRGQTELIVDPADSLTAEPVDCDLLFLDTVHTANHLLREMERHGSRARRIVLHDTQVYGERGEDGGPGLLPAVRRYLETRPEWFILSHTPVNNGLTVLSHDPAEKPAVAVAPGPPVRGKGPGTELKKILAALGINPAPSCDCNAHAAQMDEWGAVGCRARREEIVAWMRAGQTRWGWKDKLHAAARAVSSGLAFRLNPLDPYPSLVDEAIRRAEQAEKAT